ncbi:hypothetical protein AX16_000264 [Volvariella volvacea WC 439]|nr:hypothetical protein AX16_000264 [Volvariella volvacea WC 439]
MSFTNLYYKRTAGTPRACYICYKPTTTVLATINTVDFLYTCTGHLKDPGFAAQVTETGDAAGGSQKPALSPEEIAKVKEEWEAQQKKKAEKQKEEAKAKEGKDGETDAEKQNKGKNEQQGESKSKESPKSPHSVSSGSSTPSSPAHERYTLHRDFFATSVRLAEHRKRRQTTQAKELAPRLPGAPQGSPSPSTPPNTSTVG